MSLNKLKTSEKISMSFALFGFFSLLIFLILINITYFFIWYNEQKQMSFSSMNQSYQNYLRSQGTGEDIIAFKQYLLEKDTIIIPQMGELICSPGVTEKIHSVSPEEIKNKWYYKDGESIYIIYSKFFPGIGEVKLFFDTTEYVTSQIIILKVGSLFIFFVFLLQFLGGKMLSRYLLKDLIGISQKLRKYSLDSDAPQLIQCQRNIPDDDEIKILAKALNISHSKIADQTDELKQFLTDVSHEFKTPLMVMSSKLDILEKKSQNSSLLHSDLAPYVESSKNSITHLNSLLETLFFLTRSESGKLIDCPEKSLINVKQYLKNKVHDIGENYVHKKITLKFDIKSTLEWNIQAELLSIICDNIIGNAFKFTPPDGTILIGADAKGFHVSDSGPGLEDREKEKIFEKFYRKDTKKEGFGIGLFLVKRISDKQGWDIQVSKSELGGATFSIYF